MTGGGAQGSRRWRAHCLAFAAPPRRALKLVALGDSLTAGYGLPPGKAFPDQLEAALRAKGCDVTIVNAGVSGDTAEDGLARYDWAVPADADALIVELGANDMLRGLSRRADEGDARGHSRPGQGRASADAARRHARRAQPRRRLRPGVRRDLSGARPEYGAILYPFFLDGVAGDPKLNQPDGLHPTAAGVAVIVARILPAVETLLDRAERPR